MHAGRCIQTVGKDENVYIVGSKQRQLKKKDTGKWFAIKQRQPSVSRAVTSWMLAQEGQKKTSMGTNLSLAEKWLRMASM